MNLTWKSGLAIGVVSVLLVAAYGGMLYGLIVPPTDPPPDKDVIPDEAEYSLFKWTGVREDATTSVTGASARVWFDANGDEVIQYSELGKFTEASGVYTSNKEYPIDFEDDDGVLHSFDLWVQSYVATYQLTYELFHMTGQAYSGGEAKSVGELEHRLTDDSLTMDGSANAVPFDTTDYNSTLSGYTGDLDIDIVLSAADYGISSQEWEGIDYEKAYGIERDLGFYVRWDGIAEGDNDAIVIADSQVMAATFLALYCTVQDKVDIGALDTSDFDINFSDGTNWFYIKTLNSGFGDLMYNTADDSAPRPSHAATFGPVTAGGTFAATYGVGLWQGCTYDNMVGGTWTKGTTLALGTAGDGWAWTWNS